MRLEQIILNNLETNQDDKCYWFNGEWHNRKNMLELINTCEKFLIASGFKSGQRLVIMLKNDPMFVALALAIWKLHGTICPLNEKAGNDALKHTLNLIQPFGLIISSEAEKNINDEIKNAWPNIIYNGGSSFENLNLSGIIRESSDENIAVIFSTSGTTGNPKAVPLTHGNLISNCTEVKKHIYEYEQSDIFLNALPNFHSFGFTCSMMLPLSFGAKIAIVPSFLPPAGTVRALLEAKVNVMYVVPAMMSYLVTAASKNKIPIEAFTSQKFICTGGDRLNPGVYSQAIKLFGRNMITEGYGLTETSPVVCMNKDIKSSKAGSVGPIIPGYEFKLKTRENLPTDLNEGVLWVKGGSVTPGYYKAPEITAERFDSDGFFNTGDYVQIDSDGYVTILDRVTDIIIVSGFNVYPQEVEKILSEHPAVQTAIVVGMPHATNGEIPEAYIQRKEGFNNVTEREIIKFAKERLAHFKVPRKVEFVDEFPLSGTGKILRRILREKSGRKSL